MTPAYKIGISAGLTLLLVGLAVSDYYFSGNELMGNLADPTAIEVIDGDAPVTGVTKNSGPNVEESIVLLDLESDESEDLTIIAQVADTTTEIQSLTILKDGDRAGSVSWVQSPDVKMIFAAMKEALLSAFSADLKDLRDETLQESGRPVRDILSFFDPSLSEERLLFVRVRDRLYEFHIAESGQDSMNQLIESLTTK